MKSGRPKILYVISHMPEPAELGVHHRIVNIGKALAKISDLTVVYAGPQIISERVEATKKIFPNLELFEYPVSTDNNLLAKFWKKIQYHSPVYFGKRCSADQSNHFSELVSNNDIVWYHTVRSTEFFGLQGPVTVLDLDDLNSSKFKAKEPFLKTFRQKLGNKLLQYKWRHKERSVLNHCDKVVVCSEHDLELLSANNVRCLPNCFAKTENKEKDLSTSATLGFVGSLEYGPNADGLAWFIREVWPIILSEKSDVKLTAVGNVGKVDVVATDNYEHLGFVDNIEEEFAKWSALIVPIRYGGGTRVKIVEAFSKRCPVVSTSIAIYGIDAENCKEAFVSDSAEGFAKACLNVIENKELAINVAKNAYRLYENNYSIESLEEKVKSLVLDLMGNRND